MRYEKQYFSISSLTQNEGGILPPNKSKLVQIALELAQEISEVVDQESLEGTKHINSKSRLI